MDTLIYCEEYIHSKLELTDGCLQNDYVSKCKGLIVSSPDSCLAKKYRNYILVSSIFPMSVTPLVKVGAGLILKDNFVRYLEPGQHIVQQNGFSDLRITCHTQFVDFSFNKQNLDLDLVIISNITVTNLDIYTPLDLNYSIHKSIELTLHQVKVHGYFHSITFTVLGVFTLGAVVFAIYIFAMKRRCFIFQDNKGNEKSKNVSDNDISINNRSTVVYDIAS